MISTYHKSVIIFFAAVVARLAFHWATGFTADDAFITYRYAENIALGNGFVYNLGERVLGTTTPLFTLLLSLMAVLSIGVPTASLFMSVLASGLTASLIYRLAHLLRFGRAAWLPALAFILWPRSLAADCSGMETALFTMLITAALYYKHRRMFFYAVGLATLATLTRPEGGMLMLLVIAAACYHDRHHWKQYLALPLVLIVPWLLFAQFYFGSMVPHSIIGKLALYSRFGAESCWDHLVYLLGWNSAAGWLLTSAAVIGGYWLNRKQNYGWLEIGWMLGMIGFFTFSRTHLFAWYIVPIYPIYLLFACAVIVHVCDRVTMIQQNPIYTTRIVALLMIFALGMGNYNQASYLRGFQDYMEKVNKQVGLYLYVEGDRIRDRAAVEDIGYIGYYSEMRILDRDGLVSPEAPMYNRAGRYLDLVLDEKPRWVGGAVGSPISPFMNDSLFLEHYQLEKVFELNGVAKYNLYSRIR